MQGSLREIAYASKEKGYIYGNYSVWHKPKNTCKSVRAAEPIWRTQLRKIAKLI